MKSKLLIAAASLVLAILGIAFAPTVWTQANDRMAMVREQANRAVAEPFRGITTNGRVERGLFAIKATGISTAPVKAAAEAFLAGLTEEQRKRTVFPVDDNEWRLWDNRHFPPRQGVSFKEMTPQSRELAFGLIRASLSAKGLQKTSDIMKLNETLAELANDWDEYGQWLYWITIMGAPSATEPWGWQLDGHHAIVNYFVLGDQVVMTPTFMGSEPVRADAGKFKGTIVLQEEQDKGSRLMGALDASQKARAVIRGRKGPTESLAQAYTDNLVLDYAGIPAAALTSSQREMLLDLIGTYVADMREGHATVRMEEVRRHLDRTYFAWIGDTDPRGVFYYRIQSPVILIEFDHQARVAPRDARTGTGSRDHIHTLVRTPNGNDYGKDLLRQHHARQKHGK